MQKAYFNKFRIFILNYFIMNIYQIKLRNLALICQINNIILLI
jgi:hypothetical protein